MPKFTTTQSKIISILSDGLPHSRDELLKCLPDELGSYNNVTVHLSNIRNILRPIGQDIICELHKRSIYYRHVRLLKSNNE